MCEGAGPKVDDLPLDNREEEDYSPICVSVSLVENFVDSLA